MTGQQEILFVCVENAGRSQMAQAFAEKYGMKSSSAGTIPSSRINPLVAELMKEKGIDLSRNKPKLLTQEMIENASLVVTMGCSVEEACPKPILAQMQKKLIDWNLPDTKGKNSEEVRKIRDEIKKRVIALSRNEIINHRE
jgi:arsenate reductase (thioredoxin)